MADVKENSQARALKSAHIFEGMCADENQVIAARALTFGELYRVLEKKYGDKKSAEILLWLMDDPDIRRVVDTTKWYLSESFGHDGFYDYKILLLVGKQVTAYVVRTFKKLLAA